MQNQNWQYFVESVLEVCRTQEIGKTIRKPQANLLIDTVENITITKKRIKFYANTLNKTCIWQLKTYQLKNFQKEKRILIEKTFRHGTLFMNLIVG